MMVDHGQELAEAADGELALPAPEQLSPIEIQQLYFENLNECDWVKYEKKDRNCLIQNIAFALFGSPSEVGELTEVLCNEVACLNGYNSEQNEVVMKIFEKLCDQSKYSHNDEDIFMSILLVVCARPKPLRFYEFEPSDYWFDLHTKKDIDIWCTPVFRIRKCIPTIAGVKSCRVYIDDSARVYHSWESYLTNNVQPKCVLIAPENGDYTGTILEGENTFVVNLTVAPSPNLGVKARVLRTADTTTTVASLGALGVLGASAFTPVGPVVLTGAVVATVTTGIYGLVRSSLHLRDRKTHEQTISPTDPEARGSWLNIAASSVGLTAGAASTLLSRSAAAGTNMTKTGQALAMSVDILRHANLVTGGVGVAHSLAHMITKYQKHGKGPTPLELFQFTSSTLFFWNAVMSNRTAQNIIEDAQAQTINDYRTTLRSNRHRKMFDKISAESRRVQGSVQGNAEVIQGIRNIADKDQFFADVVKINKDLNQHKLKISMTADGRVNLNSQHPVNPSELYNMGREGRTELFTSLGPASTALRNVPTRLVASPVSAQNFEEFEEQNTSVMVNISPGEVLRIGAFLVRVTSQDAEGIAEMLQDLSQDVHANLMTVCLNLLSKLVPKDIASMKLMSPDEDLIVQVVRFVFNYMRHSRPLGDPSMEDDNGIVIVLKEFFQDGVVRQDTILKLKDRFMAWVNGELKVWRELYPDRKQEICETCQGVRYA